MNAPELRGIEMLSAILLALIWAGAANAQQLALAGGISAGSVPRALEPLCVHTRRLRGPGLTGRAELASGRFGAGATVDYVARIGVRDAASCIPRSGTSVDSVFAPAGNSATTLAANAWIVVHGGWRIGAEAGNVINHSSWFVGPSLGVTYRRVQIDVAGRRHSIHFDEVTRDSGSSAREISRVSRREGSWGAVARLLVRSSP